MDKREKYKKIEIDEECPSYEGYSEILIIGGRYFRSWDAESYASGIDEITEEEYEKLLKFKLKEEE
jgi:hypothetical protein